MIFDVDISSLIPKLMPVRWRTVKHIHWLRALLSPTIWLKGKFDANRANNLYYLNHNGQVYSIEAALNDALDPINRLIHIIDGTYIDSDFLYLDSESEPIWLGLDSEEGSTPYPDPVPLYTISETWPNGYSFIIKVPTAVSITVGYSEARVRGIVDKYRIMSVANYEVIIY